MAAMCAGDVIVGVQRFADPHGDGFLTYIKVREARHQRASVQIVHLFFEQPDHQHAPVHVQVQIGAGSRIGFRRIDGGGHRSYSRLRTPDILASTSNTTAKSRST